MEIYRDILTTSFVRICSPISLAFLFPFEQSTATRSSKQAVKIKRNPNDILNHQGGAFLEAQPA
jgi:hypothetical protein